MKKRLLTGIAVLSGVLALASCGNVNINQDPSTNQGDTPSSS